MQLKAKTHTIAIVGINRESAAVLSELLETDGANVIRILNHECEDLHDLKQYPQIDIVINTTNDVNVYRKLRKLHLSHLDILSGLSARILFSTGSHALLAPALAEDKSRLLNSLHEIREAIYLSKNKDELLKLVLNVAIRSIGADSGSIMLVDPKKKVLKIEIAEGLDRGIVKSTTQKVGKGIAGTVAKTGVPLLIKGAPDKDRYASDFERSDLVSSICTPLVIGDEIVGVLSINSKRDDRVFSEEDLAYVKKLGDFTADIIKTSKEYERTTSSTFLLSLLNNARDILNLKYPFDERLSLLLLKVANAFHAEICNYYDFYADKGVFMAKASSSFNLNLIKGKKLKLNDYFSKCVLEADDVVCLNVPDQNAGAENSRQKWYLMHPVKVGGEMVGLLFLHMLSEKDDLKEESSIVAKIGDMIATDLSKNIEMESFRVQSIKFSAISEVSFDLAAARNRHECANLVISHACVILEAESSILRIYNGVTETLDVLDSFSLKTFGHLKELEALDGMVSRDVMLNKTPLLIRDLSKSSYGWPGVDAKSVLCMYLERGGRVIGTLSLYDKKSLDLYMSRSFSQKDREIFLNFCLQASKALDRFISSDAPSAAASRGTIA
jgi:putative methionine-R-sulfoxide reductase with GAF domain